MPTDIAEAGGAQQGVTQGVQNYITIGVCLQTTVMGYLHAAQHQPVAPFEGMGIETLSDSHDRPCR
jgi:hypothetical protein